MNGKQFANREPEKRQGNLDPEDQKRDIKKKWENGTRDSGETEKGKLGRKWVIIPRPLKGVQIQGSHDGDLEGHSKRKSHKKQKMRRIHYRRGFRPVEYGQASYGPAGNHRASTRSVSSHC